MRGLTAWISLHPGAVPRLVEQNGAVKVSRVACEPFTVTQLLPYVTPRHVCFVRPCLCVSSYVRVFLYASGTLHRGVPNQGMISVHACSAHTECDLFDLIRGFDLTNRACREL